MRLNRRRLIVAPLTILSLCFASAAYAGGGNPSLTNDCDIAITLMCHFDGNITLNNLNLVEATYNAQLPQVPTLDLNPTGFFSGSYTPNPGQDIKSGMIMANFLVSYFAVKGGNAFELYKLATPSTQFSWNTNDIPNGGGNAPGLSHLLWIGYSAAPPPPPPPPPTGVPEPATWAMMIIGFGAAGSMLRRRKTIIA